MSELIDARRVRFVGLDNTSELTTWGLASSVAQITRIYRVKVDRCEG